MHSLGHDRRLFFRNRLGFRAIMRANLRLPSREVNKTEPCVRSTDTLGSHATCELGSRLIIS